MVALLLVAALALAGCGVPGLASEQTPATSALPQTVSPASAGPDSAATSGTLARQLAGRTFRSTSVSGRELAPGSTIRIEFHDDGTVEASPGCNMLTGAAAWDGDVLSVANMGTTEIGCDQPRMDQDQWFMGLLQAGVTAALTGDELTLTGDGVILDLLDRRIADPDRPVITSDEFGADPDDPAAPATGPGATSPGWQPPGSTATGAP